MAAFFHYKMTVRAIRHCRVGFVAGELCTGHFDGTKHIHIHAVGESQSAEFGRLQIRMRTVHVVEGYTRRYFVRFFILVIRHRYYQRCFCRQGIVTCGQNVIVGHKDNHILIGIVVGVSNSVFQFGIGDIPNAADTDTVILCGLCCSQEITVSLVVFDTGYNLHFCFPFGGYTIVVGLEIASSKIHCAIQRCTELTAKDGKRAAYALCRIRATCDGRQFLHCGCSSYYFQSAGSTSDCSTVDVSCAARNGDSCCTVERTSIKGKGAI